MQQQDGEYQTRAKQEKHVSFQLQFSASICLERTMTAHKRELPTVKGLHLMILFFLSAAEKDCEIKCPYKNKDAMLVTAAKDSSCSLK